MSLDVGGILGPDGSIARRLAHYELRPQQLQLAGAVAKALASRKHLVAEAGTGVGKSFAYLVPAILFATADQVEQDNKPAPDGNPAEQEASRRVVISTHTISLQEQLIEKDLPLLNAVIPREFSSVLVKGRANYLSLRRFGNAQARAMSLFQESEFEQLEQLKTWVRETQDGSLSSLPFRPQGSLWDEVASDTTNCLGRKCKQFKDCFYFRARRRIQGAQILVVNHALFFTDLAVRKEAGFGIIPDYDAAILDECHTIESVASSHLGIKITSGQVQYTLNKLYNPSTGKGLFAALKLDRMIEKVNHAHNLLDQLVFDLDQWMRGDQAASKRVTTPHIVPDLLSDVFREVATRLKHMADNADDASRRQDLTSTATRLEAVTSNLGDWLSQRDQESVYWLERTFTRRGDLRVELHAAPIDVSHQMRESLFQQVPSVIMTSATISTGREGGFEFFQSRVGATGSLTAKLGSPFDFRRQVELIVVRDMPDPSSNRARYEALLPAMIKRYVQQTEGHAFILFTSYSSLRSTARKLQAWFAEQNLALYSQAAGTPRSQLLDQFKRNPRGALFGTDSFWQGVDVPGSALSNVIITKLPFSVPDHPLLAARLDAIRDAGGNPFRDYQIPEAVIKLRQGFGRLIRTAQDRGIVVILDPRVTSKSYGRAFLEALPNCERATHSIADVPTE